MLPSVTNVSAPQVVPDIPALRKRHETDKDEGFYNVSKSVNPFSMSAAGKGSETQYGKDNHVLHTEREKDEKF